MAKKPKETERSYGIVGVSRRNAKDLAALVGSAFKDGHSWIRLELYGKGKWTKKELDHLSKGLAKLGQDLLKDILKKRPLHLVNLQEVMDPPDGCVFFSDMLLADSSGNFLLVPPQWRFDGRGVKLGNVDQGVKDYHDCRYDARSKRCLGCESRNRKKLDKLFDANATAEFERGIGKILRNLEYLSKGKSVFKTYLKKLREDKDQESGLLINEGA